MSQHKDQAALTGRHVLLALGAFFGLILAVNGVFVALALGSFAGVETDQAYLKGLAYNRVLERAAAQRALGWSVVLEVAPRGEGDVLRARYRDSAGRPLTGLAVAVTLRHPTQSALDRRLPLEDLGAGRYAAGLDALARGQWRAALEAGRGEGLLHRREERLWLK